MKKSLFLLSLLLCVSCVEKPDGGDMDGASAFGGYLLDLGLPSGTIWVGVNVGGKKNTDAGNYYAWGESFKKDSYSQDNYTYNGTQLPSSWDQVDGWCGYLPTSAQWKELYDNTDVSSVYVNGVPCYKFQSRVDTTYMLLPLCGYYNGSTLIEKTHIKSGSNWIENPMSFYWARDKDTSYGNPGPYHNSVAYDFAALMKGSVLGGTAWYGCPVRLVNTK